MPFSGILLLPCPSGSASLHLPIVQLLLTCLFAYAAWLLQDGAVEALRKVKVLTYTGLASFLFSAFKWVFNGSDYACGFGVWPSFGFAALKYTFNFDWQLNYVGAGAVTDAAAYSAVVHAHHAANHCPDVFSRRPFAGADTDVAARHGAAVVSSFHAVHHWPCICFCIRTRIYTCSFSTLTLPLTPDWGLVLLVEWRMSHNITHSCMCMCSQGVLRELRRRR
jgi:hypothetical protein